MGRRTHSSRGVSPVIATIILSAAVITIGAAIWNYSQGATTVIANDYVNGTLSLLNEVIERFTIEHVCNNSERNLLYVWIYNYGEVDIVIDLYANATDEYNSTLETAISSGDLVKITVSFEGNPLKTGDEVAIKAHSRRQNNVYYIYYVT
jgi:threonine dehydrogenase-like Zn-dependent dehydrogenase